MKAYVLHNVNELKYEEVPQPSLQPGWALIKVMAAGVCGSDIPRIYRDGAHRMPLIPGHEFSGRVEAVAEDGDASWVGKKVGIFPLIPCGICPQCQKKQFEMCRNYNYLGSRTDGGFAEYVAAPVKNLIEINQNVSYEAIAMMEPMAVAVHSIRAIAPAKVDVIVVSGLGTIGLFIVMYLIASGAEHVLVVGNKDFQKNQAMKLGISEEDYCDSRFCDVKEWILSKTDNQGAGVFFECVGKNETISLAIDSAAPGGKVMLVGNPYSEMKLDKNVYWKILRHELTVKGTWNSSFTGEDTDDWHYVKACLEAKLVYPEAMITHKLGPEELQKGMEIMRDKTEDYVKVMMSMDTAQHKDTKDYDALIVVTPKDYKRVERLYDRLFQWLPVRRIIFIGSDEVGEYVKASGYGDQIGFINENDLLPFDAVNKVMADALSGVLDGPVPRGVTGWYYQQFLKMKYAQVCEDEYYMVWDGDTIPCGPFSMFKEGTDIPFLDMKSEYHEPYFETLTKLLPGMYRCVEKSFIAEHMLMNCEIMKELIRTIEGNEAIKGKEFWEKAIYAVDPEKLPSNSFSEFETYGTYVALKHPMAYRLRPWHSFRYGGEFFEQDEIDDIDLAWLKRDFFAISFEKMHSVREDHRNLFSNKEYQAKLSARQMLEIAQEEFGEECYREVW